MRYPCPDRPALGAILATPETQERLDRRGWTRNLSMRDFTERTRLMRDLTRVYETVRCGRRLDLVADDLVILAARIEHIPQPHIGGWPITTWQPAA